MRDIHIDKRGRRIVIRSDGPITGLKTAIPGAYESTSGHWTVPLSLESCKLLQLKYGKRLKVSNELKRWATGVQQSRKYMANLARQKDATLRHVKRKAPKLSAAIATRSYQNVGARFIADNAATLIADDPGLGKTLMTLAGILEADVPGPYLIVAPKTAADSVWKREIERWLPPEHRAIIMPNRGDQRDKVLNRIRYGPKTWVIVHPEMVQVQAWRICADCGSRTLLRQRQKLILSCGHQKDNRTKVEYVATHVRLFEVEWGVVVVDESHESLIRRSGVPTQRRQGLEMLPLRGDGLKIAMSGTPFESKPHQLWGTLNWLDPVQYSAFHRWAELYWQKGGFTGFEIGELHKDREKMLWSSLNAIALRRTKAEVAQDLPPKMEVGTPLNPDDPASPVGIWLPMEGKQEQAYRHMEKLSVAELDSGMLSATSALAELTRLKQLACAYGAIEERMVQGHCKDDICRSCERHGWHEELSFSYKPTLPSNKLAWTLEALEEWGYPKDPLTNVVIVSFYTGILNMFAGEIERHFRTKAGAPLCTAITGQTPGNKRREIIDRFNSKSGPRIMLLNVKAGGTAITLDTADRMIFISETRIPDQQKQAEDRIHRVSNPRQCMYYYLRSLDSVDVGTAVINQELIADTHRLLDQRRGVNYMRHVLDLSRPV
jgi:SNF2 family DNA or RNA helicase